MRNTHNIQAVLADIDGTISPAKGRSRDLFQLLRIRTFCDLAKRCLTAAFALATGRNRSYAEDMLQSLGIPSRIPHIIENGAGLYLADKDEVIPHPSIGLFEESRHAIAGIIQSIIRETGCIQDREKIFMFTLYPGPMADIALLFEIVQSRLEAFRDIVDVLYSSSAVDVMPKGIDKGAGLEFFCTYTGIKASNVLAIGDSHNDLALLKAAGYAACPGNATEEIIACVRSKGDHGYCALANTTAGVIKILEHFLDLDLPDSRLRKLSLEQALRMKQEVLCALIPGENVTVTGKRVYITIPDDPYIANTHQQMAAISGDSNGAHHRWAAGGIAPIVSTPQGDYLVTLYRDEHAMTWPNTLTIPTGLSSNESEFLNTDETIFREGFEEILMRTPNGLFAPKSHGITNTVDVESIMSNGLGLARTYWPTMSDDLDWIPTDVVTTAHDKSVTIDWRGKRRIMSCLVTFHNVTSGIDMVKIVWINSPYQIDQLAFADGEESVHGSLLDRNVHLISLDEVRRWTSEGGDLNASQSFANGKELGPQTLAGIKPLPFLEDAMRAIVVTFP